MHRLCLTFILGSLSILAGCGSTPPSRPPPAKKLVPKFVYVANYGSASVSGFGTGSSSVIQWYSPPEGVFPTDSIRVRASVSRHMKGINVPDKLLLPSELAIPSRALLETMGRNTGGPRRTSVSNGLVGNEFWIVAEHGMQADYVRNLAKNPKNPIEAAPWNSGRLPQRYCERAPAR